MRHGQEIPEQAHEGDTHPSRGVRVHQDPGLRRGSHTQSTRILILL